MKLGGSQRPSLESVGVVDRIDEVLRESADLVVRHQMQRTKECVDRALQTATPAYGGVYVQHWIGDEGWLGDFNEFNSWACISTLCRCDYIEIGGVEYYLDYDEDLFRSDYDTSDDELRQLRRVWSYASVEYRAARYGRPLPPLRMTSTGA